MNYIVNIENANPELLEKVIRTLDEQKFKRVNFKRGATGIRVFTNNKGVNCYTYGTYLGYIVYRRSGMKDYMEAETISLEGLLQVLKPTKEPALTTRVSTPELHPTTRRLPSGAGS